MPIDWSPLIDMVRSNHRFVLSSHVRPDADALGSELALAATLEAMGKSVRIVNPSQAPPGLAFLDPDRRAIKLGDGITADEIRDTDAHFIVDTSAWVQLQEVGTAFRNSKAQARACIDHHVSSDDLGCLVLKDTTAAACGELIFEFIEALGQSISEKTATVLYCAIATDTGWFRFPSTTQRTMTIAGKLIACGAQPHVLYRQIYEQHSAARMRLVGRVLSRITVDCDGRLAWLSVTQDDFRDTGAVPSDTEDLVNECLRIAGVQAAFIAVEQQNQTIKCSLRSRADLNVAAVAELFGGGGHRQAAGTVLPGPLNDALAKILPPMQRVVTAAP